MHLFGSSGIRAKVDSDLLHLALKVGMAVGNLYRHVLVGGDTRTSTEAMKHAVVSGILSAGGTCSDAGVAPTPTIGLAGRGFDAAAMITASHNPPEYNGIKLLNPDGCAFDGEQRRQLERMVAEGSQRVAPWSQIGAGVVYPGAIEQHIDRIVEDFPTKLKIKVVVDSGCGATSLVTPYLLRRLGCEVIALNTYPCGSFAHDIEPVEANLGDLIKATGDMGADLGIAHDGDGDRMMAVDDRGKFVTGDKMLAIFARETGANHVVTTVDASMAIDEMGFRVVRTPVGDIYVSEEMRKGGDFGGEASGSWVFPHVSLCPDGVYAAAKIAAICSEKRLSSLVDGVPEYPLRRGNTSSEGVVMSRLEKRLTALKPLAVNNIDGIKLNFADGWLLIRPSGTEPKIRLTVEARDEARMNQLYDEGIRAIQESKGEVK